MAQPEIDQNRIILPPPYKRIYVPMTDEELTETTPGSIVMNEHGKALKSFLQFEGLTGQFIEATNVWFRGTMAQQVASRTLISSKGKRVEFTHVFPTPPSYSTASGESLLLTPEQCRNEGLTYMSSIYCDAVLKDEAGKVLSKKEKIFIGRVPVMLGSELCILKDKTDEERTQLGECKTDPLGYFIIRGLERFVVLQEGLRRNVLYLYLRKVNNVDRPVVNITSNSITGSSSITLYKGSKRALKLNLRLFGRNSKKTIPVLAIFSLFGITDPEAIFRLLASFTRSQWVKKIWLQLQQTFFKLTNTSDIVAYCFRKWEQKSLGSYEEDKKLLMDELSKELFPHMNGEPIERKLDLLAMMVVKMAEYMAGLRELDSRDSWDNKRIFSAAICMEQLFNGLWRKMTDLAQDTITAKNHEDLDSMIKSLSPNIMTDEFITSFSTASWGVKPYKSVSFMKENIADILKRESILSTIAQLRKLNTPVHRRGKATNIRMVQVSQWGYVCVGETPDGENCGLVKYLSTTCYLSIDRPEEPVRVFLNKYIVSSPTIAESSKILLNGKFLGWCSGPLVRDICITKRRNRTFPKDMCVILNDDNALNIYIDGSRPTRPLLIVNDKEQLVIDEKNLWGKDFNILMDEGAVEYIDALEASTIKLAQTADGLRSKKNDIIALSETLETVKQALKDVRGGKKVIRQYIDKEGFDIQEEATEKTLLHELHDTETALNKVMRSKKYTHCELDPSATLGVSAAVMPLANYNQAPRVSYQCNMGKQALGVYHSNHLNRFDSLTKVLAFPSRPIFEPQMNHMIGLTEFPNGQNIIVAIMALQYNQEDAFVMKREAVERGLFWYTKYTSYKAVQKSTPDFAEKFGRPIARKGESASKYSHIEESGVPRIGTVLESGDCIIGKRRRVKATEEEENASVFMAVGERGVVEKVYEGTSDNLKFIRVKIRTVRKPTIGDKLASRYAQKGTVGMILPSADLPFISTDEMVRREYIERALIQIENNLKVLNPKKDKEKIKVNKEAKVKFQQELEVLLKHPNVNGLVPDLFINPHSIPSRMTIAKVYEFVASKVGVLKGEFVDATAFRPFDIDEFSAYLVQNGFEGSGTHTMYQGTTGRKLQAQIYTGPCFYQMLRHHATDKLQHRGLGAVKENTRQPIGGRALEGGLRVGEMERDALISHGASKTLLERLCLVSDKYTTAYCKNCGTLAIANHMAGEYECRNCREKGDFGTLTTPYAMKLVADLLQGAGFKVKYNLENANK
jgi:DNA-directed RNA polymerase II subunit RPB2